MVQDEIAYSVLNIEADFRSDRSTSDFAKRDWEIEALV